MPWNTAGNIKGPKGDKGDPGNAADIAALIHAATAKIPADADELPILDSGASWALRKFTWASLKTALQDVFFYRGNIVGTVSQSGGVPTGAIIQRGSNANGEFVRFADGTQICVSMVFGPTAITTPDGQMFISNSFTFGVYPAAFSNIPICSPVVYDGGGAWIMNGTIPPTSTSPGNIYLVSAVSRTNNYRVGYVAIGRWF